MRVVSAPLWFAVDDMTGTNGRPSIWAPYATPHSIASIRVEWSLSEGAGRKLWDNMWSFSRHRSRGDPSITVTTTSSERLPRRCRVRVFCTQLFTPTLTSPPGYLNHQQFPSRTITNFGASPLNFYGISGECRFSETNNLLGYTLAEEAV